MKIEFSIYWIDDNPDIYDSIRDEIEQHISDNHGLTLNVTYVKETSTALYDIKQKNPYLVVVDYKLTGGARGDAFITEMRAQGQLHDVFFYTQDGFQPEDRDRFFSSFSSGLTMGVHYADKKHAKSRLCKIIDLKLNQVSDLSTQRGWIVADVIELENELDEILEKLSNTIHPAFGSMMTRLLGDSRVDFGCRDQLLNGALKDMRKHILTQNPKHEILPTLGLIKDTVSLFSKEIIQVRNSIAHQRHFEMEGGGITLPARQKSQDPITYNLEFLKQVRQNIKKHRTNFQNIQKLLNSGVLRS